MKKKSEITLKMIFELLAGMIILSLFVYAGYSYGSDEAAFKARTAQEMANEISVLCSLGGNAQISFTDMPKLVVESKDDVIYIYSQKYGKDKDSSIGKADVPKPGCIENRVVNSPKSLVLAKKEGKVVFENA